MATAEAVKNALTTTKKPRTLQDLIKDSAKELSRALPEHMRPERLVRIALTLIRTNPELSKCAPESFLGALFVSAQMGVEPVAGQAYILPFNNRRNVGGEWTTVKEAQFILGYKGLASLFYRHEKAVLLSWGIVHEKDDCEFEYGTNAHLRHVPFKGDRGSVIGYYVIANLTGGGKPFLYWTREECVEHGKKHSKTYDKKGEKFYPTSPWVTNEEAMCLKTVLIQLGKLLPISVEIQRAIQADETSREYKSGIEDALDLPTTTDWSDEPFDAETIPPGDKKAEAAKPAVAKSSQGFIIEKLTRKDLGNGTTRTFAYINGSKFFSDDTGMGVALAAWKEKQTPIMYSSEEKETDGAFRILEAEPFKA